MGIRNLFLGTTIVAVSALVASITTYKVIERSDISETTATEAIGLPIQKAAFTQPSV